MTTILEVKNLQKHYIQTKGFLKRDRKVIKAVDGIDFKIHAGQIVGMVGESGSGKSTAAQASIRLLEPTDGQISFLQKDLRALSHKELRSIRKDVQMVFQNPLASLNPRKSVLDIISEAMLFHKLVKPGQQRVARTLKILDQVGLSKEALYLYPHQFSGGQQQRISIGRALALNPKLIICDEAVSALDLSVQAEILNLLYELKIEHGLSYLFISHDLAVVQAFCDFVYVLYQGKVVESGPSQQIFAKPKHPYTQLLLASTLKKHPREKKVFAHLPAEGEKRDTGCPFFGRCGVRTEPCQHLAPPIKRSKSDKHTYTCIH